MNSKKQLGQFYTTNAEYILRDINIPNIVGINIIEPFVGRGDLLPYIISQSNKNESKIFCYDIIENKEIIEYINLNPIINFECVDTFNKNIDYNNSYIITNPPYISRNKNIDKKIYNKYKENDLYKCFIRILINSGCIGGILIIPLNFFCSIRQSDIKLRKDFLNKYVIKVINIFEEKIFDDTSYNICCFQYIIKNLNNDLSNINMNVICNGNIIRTLDILLNDDNNYTFGGEIYNIPNNIYNIQVYRLTEKNKNEKYSNIFVKCIDDNENSKIRFEYNEIPYIDNTLNLSCRTFATLIIKPYIEEEKQKILIKICNDYINEYRDKYYSLFLTNYRETKGRFMRKRISYDLVYNIIINNIVINYDKLF